MLKLKLLWGFLSVSLLLVLYQNFVFPEFPLRNIDTRTIQYKNGTITTVTPHIPAHDLSLDGRIALSRAYKNPNRPPFMVMKPENVVKHIKHPSNSLVGANIFGGNAYDRFNAGEVFQQAFGTKLNGYKISRSILCEKTAVKKSPYACRKGSRDCYRLTLVTRYRETNASGAQLSARLASVDVIVEVANPKTKNAYIANVRKVRNSEKIGPPLRYSKLAEPVIVGDGRLLITRVQDATIDIPYANGRVQRKNKINIVYSVYPANRGGRPTPQCDVSQWKTVLPISHAYYDDINSMRRRYKFARHPFRDGLGKAIPDGEDLGGSYQWMDIDAANLFFMATGRGDNYYNNNKGIYPERGASNAYKRPGFGGVDATDVENRGARTVGISMAGFWTKGKTVLFDSLLNNADYNFKVSSTKIGDPTRQIRLYRQTPRGQYYERVGAVRELGDEVQKQLYAPHLSHNANFIGSLERRLNYVEAIKPVTPRDLVWHFGSTRHTEELVFDDFVNPYFLINAEMVPAVGHRNGTMSMRLYDGIARGVETGHDLSSFPRPPLRGTPLAFQNAATAEKSFMAVPDYGRAIGDVRAEPIAKGGIKGKGAWLETRSGIQFEIPDQSQSKFDVVTHRNWYVSVFLDPRKFSSNSKRYQKTLLRLSDGSEIRLTKENSGANIAYDHIKFFRNSTYLGSFRLPAAHHIAFKKWVNIGIEFKNGMRPGIYINGFMLGRANIARGQGQNLKNFFNIRPGWTVTLGSHGPNNGIKGWVDDFKVLARLPTLEEKCNYAHGTIVKVSSNERYWLNRANTYPSWLHRHIASRLKQPSSSRYLCYTQYGEVSMKNLTVQERYAHLGNLPRGSQSVRHVLTHQRKRLKYGQPRPEFSNNRFCTSCHLDRNIYPFKELNTDALTVNSRFTVENDPRRQPSQPDPWISGVIPANYFGKGKPSKTLRSKGLHKIDQWVLGR